MAGTLPRTSMTETRQPVMTSQNTRETDTGSIDGYYCMQVQMKPVEQGVADNHVLKGLLSRVRKHKWAQGKV